ncbi:restriction endonuclease [Paenibacillus barcinonensis]|nr:restriction endonuclease [Paenibacillus barcinonensis]QKS57797.1 restriction endonuclease [Paenibacillus barcinonensis]
MVNKGITFETFVHEVYSAILRLEDKTVLISKNVTILGKTGASHQFDVYYEFTKANVKHRVAIECKNHSRPIDKGKVGEFKSKILDIDNLMGIMVSASGYQSGASTYANGTGIILMTLDDLPTFTQVVAMQFKRALLPEPSVIGQPFWALMEVDKTGEITGTYHSVNDDRVKMRIPLFYSKNHAEQYCEAMPSKDFTVRGLNQDQLKILLSITKHQDVGFILIPFAPNQENGQVLSYILNHDELMEEYVIE